MDTSPRRRLTRRTKWIIAGACALVLGYPLSYGPLIMASDHGYIPDAALPVLVIYDPLLRLLGTPIGKPFDWYAQQWDELSISLLNPDQPDQ